MRFGFHVVWWFACSAILSAGCREDQATTSAASTQAASTQPAGASRPASSTTPGGRAVEIVWKPIFRGVEMSTAAADEPRPLQVRAVRVDLREPTIDFLVTPSNAAEPLDCGARTTSEFLTEFKCQVAINGSAFKPLVGQRGEAVDVLGLSLSRGDLYSKPNDYDAVLIGKDHRVWIDQAPVKPGKAFHGVSGFHALLIGGQNVAKADQLHPRSAAGVTRDGRYLILMVIDGRQAGYSEGTSTAETAEWIRQFGAHDALNLDGGGSTALVMEGPDGKPVVLNRPSGVVERRVANHLGVFARRLP